MTRRVPASELLGRDVARKRDGATGRVVSVEDCLTSRTALRPFKTIVTIRWHDAEVSQAAGGDSTGDLGWFRSNFKLLGEEGR